MGANIRKEGPTAIVDGRQEADRGPGDGQRPAGLGGAGAGRAWSPAGRRPISRVYHIDRGYERIEERLAALGR